MDMNRFNTTMACAIKNLFWNALRISLNDPGLGLYMLNMIMRQNRASNRRSRWEKQGIHVPPFLITSITQRCNLRCKGCYSMKLHDQKGEELSTEKMIEIFAEAGELGVAFILIAGGEPFVRADLLDITARFPDIIFPVFTNGLMIDEEKIAQLKKQKNTVLIFSLEGLKNATDTRRGEGVFNAIQSRMELMHRAGLFFGTSLTLTRENFSVLTDDSFIQGIIKRGCRILFYVEYVPVDEGSEHLVVTNEQRDILRAKLDEFRRNYKGLFVSFPGDEEKFGGCLSSGRGFVHIGSDGSLEPCPFAPYSDTNLKNISLKDALQSELLAEIRKSPEHLSETDSGCALWNNRDWVQSLMANGVTR